MSARSGIVTAMAEQVSALFIGEGDYITNLYGNVDNKVKHFEDVEDYPYISITPGAETREDKPSSFTWSNLTVNITLYVKSEENAQEELESLITDVENFLDTHLQLPYNVNTSEGIITSTTTDNSISSITTDEGILDPMALGQIVVNVLYEKVRRIST